MPFSGAYITQTTGGVFIHSAPGRYVAWILAFMVVVPLTGYLWRRGIGGTFVKGAFVAAFTIPLLIVPGIATESIRVDPDALEVRTGFWFDPTIRRIDLRDVTHVARLLKPVPQRGLPRKDAFWEVRYRDGHGELLHLSDLFQANQEPVVTALRLRGIPVD